ncbi:hypothetical protein H7X46_17310 [Pseudonocardia sp. C8]|uniref:hypothetical protein n=1 Tax=Pseudonocardia sp. C8 TaxID=2762759 RepID=UPI0016431AC2|nr:hypothetical protein [Pseudonocardia sp. C8]MBC3192826.1 hypothetical protein [Pseudonocardia sp. C8]
MAEPTRSGAARRAGVLIALAVASGGACGDEPGGGQPSGVTGVAVVDVGCPTLTTAEACPTRPLPAHVRITDPGSSATVAEVRTPPDGTFRVELAPGQYRLHATTVDGRPLPYAEPLTVEVPEGRFTPVTIRFDSGVR